VLEHSFTLFILGETLIILVHVFFLPQVHLLKMLIRLDYLCRKLDCWRAMVVLESSLANLPDDIIANPEWIESVVNMWNCNRKSLFEGGADPAQLKSIVHNTRLSGELLKAYLEMELKNGREMYLTIIS